MTTGPWFSVHMRSMTEQIKTCPDLDAARYASEHGLPLPAEECDHQDENCPHWTTLTPEQEAEIDALPCDMVHERPYDFAYCAVHDTTFALGDVCKYQKINEARKVEAE